MAETTKWATVEGVAEHLGISLRTVRVWLYTTDIPKYQPTGEGGRILFDLAEVDEWVKTHRAA